MDPYERLCCLTLDEMSLHSKVDLNATGTVYGKTTLPGKSESEMANHGLVFMIGGITTRWKQVVAYHLSGSSVDGKVLRDIIIDILKATFEIGVRVVAVNLDMGAANQSMWSALGISSKKGKPILWCRW
jgi:hypothetical protein